MVAGDPDFETSLEIVKTFVDNGADALEIGFPFSDPVADGPTVQAADIRALQQEDDHRKMFPIHPQNQEIHPHPHWPLGVLQSNL